jgi:hypothetical protein
LGEERSLISYFFVLLSLVLEVPLLFPVLSAGAAAALFIALMAANRNPEALRGKWKWLSLPFVMPFVILLYGVFFNYDGQIGTAAAWRSNYLDVMLWLHIPIGLLLVAIARRNALVPLGLSAFQMWLSFCAAFVSYMSVTNIWL